MHTLASLAMAEQTHPLQHPISRQQTGYVVLDVIFQFMLAAHRVISQLGQAND